MSRHQQGYRRVFPGDTVARQIQGIGCELGLPFEGLLVIDEEGPASARVLEQGRIVRDQIRAILVRADVDDDSGEQIEPLGIEIAQAKRFMRDPHALEGREEGVVVALHHAHADPFGHLEIHHANDGIRRRPAGHPDLEGIVPFGNAGRAARR